MKERLLIKCDTTIYADEITNLLIENNIVSRQHDEGQDQNNKYGTAIALWCIFLFLIPGLYLVWANDLGIRSTIADYIALSMFISFLVVAFLGKISNANYICKDCNKRFHHK